MIELALLFLFGIGVAVLLLGALLWGLLKLAFGLVLIPLKLFGFVVSTLFAVAAGVLLLVLLPVGLAIFLPLLLVLVPLALIGGAVALVCHAI
ncbi:MAG: hypothetical protein ACRD2Z_06565 [Thermoanaerobaculia bacterium]